MILTVVAAAVVSIMLHTTLLASVDIPGNVLVRKMPHNATKRFTLCCLLAGLTMGHECNLPHDRAATKPLRYPRFVALGCSQAEVTLNVVRQHQRRRFRAAVAVFGMVAAHAAIIARCLWIAVVVENSFRWSSKFFAMCCHCIMASLQGYTTRAIHGDRAIVVHFDFDRIQLRPA